MTSLTQTKRKGKKNDFDERSEVVQIYIFCSSINAFLAFLCKFNLATCLIISYVYNHVADGKCTSVTGMQLPGVLDELFSYEGPLGAIFTNDVVSLYLWAPTAQVNTLFF